MGFFDKIFKGKNRPTDANKTAAKRHQEEWDFYLTNINDLPGSIMVDLGLRKIAPVNNKTHIVSVSVKMKNPNPEGLSTEEELNSLGDIEDRLVDFMTEARKAIFAGRTTSNGSRDFYFYVGDTMLIDKTISEAMVAFPGYEYDFGTNEDTDWKCYLDFLYPLPSQMQSIQNRRVINSLEKNGDPLTKERQVDHWLFFKTETGRDLFLSKIAEEGFNIVTNNYDKDLGDTPYRLQISRIDKVDYNSIDDYVIMLWKLAAKCDGEYDGWETSVEKQ
ncbi:DUF695 domain-containing protein [Mucilaginibacter polytrichastri]|uniref:DUF695 domain-containing protein n=1 Tax=Mucilaginibacter polytrichastri TaxID=1302689 RepID=A0A1Q5ZWM5_9SPHI|nr:DUF695 domain-containing protein [Mucilaginibacter polytrichastri]OKS86169.1 hypothetical protein RG47T_1620 [Mucilaginibacter polytrichastri]SFT15568.1 TIGR01619 family protein [Mucilaginibacter polytrichastri]